MRLLKLSSDNPKFRPLDFNPGLNIVAGLQKTKDGKETFNSVGKSLSLKMVHYLLGARFDPKKPEDKKLKNYLSKYGAFYLDFLHDSKAYSIKKDFSQTDYYINGDKVNQTSYSDALNKIFSINDDNLKFRRIFNCFARRYGDSYYADALTQQGQPLNDYYQRIVNLYLLGINTPLIKERYGIKEELNKIVNASKAIKEYQPTSDSTNLKDIIDKIADLQHKKDNFIIAESYDELKKEADSLTTELNELRNKVFFLQKTLEKKQSSLLDAKTSSIDINQILDIYNEAQFFFDAKISKRLDDAQIFHITLLKNREKRLLIEIENIKKELSTFSATLETKSKQRDNILKDLNNTGALEERDSITESIKTLELERDNLKKYENMLHEFNKEKSRLNTRNALIKEESIVFLENNQDRFDFIENEFRTLVKRFYNNHGGELKIKETKDTNYLFDIITDIPRDGGQAVGEVKIFCYDVLMYLLNKDLLGFLAHDGCIFSGMDTRQKATIFKTILELVKEPDFQYFINIGQNTLNDILNENSDPVILTTEDKQTINEAVILELYDKNPVNWLFGEDFS